MPAKIATIALVVRDYDEAIAFYTQSLGFTLLEDLQMGADKRWVVVAPSGSLGASLLLAKAANAEQASRVGNQTGGRVGFFLHTDDFWRDHITMKEKGIKFMEEPRVEPYGTVAVFADLYGNLWDLLQLN